jgi:V/A-type H+-transporting ATPase subunit C
MNSVTRYAAVNTKIRAMEGQFLSDEDYRSLFEMDNVRDIVRYLKKSSLGEAFDRFDESSLHRGEIEVLLKRYAIDILEKLSYYFQGPYAKFIQVLFMRFEVEDLKVLLRAIYTDRDYIHSFQTFIYIGRYGSLDFDKLAASKSYQEMLNNLKGSLYYEYLAHLKLGGEQEDKFIIEMALDQAYVSIYKRHLEHLSSHEKEVIYKLQGMRSDLLNLQWIYRGKKFYHLAPELLFNYCIRFGGRLNDAALKDLCYSGDIAELEQKMSGSRYGFLFQHDRTKDMFMERRIFRFLYYRLQEYRRRNTMDIVQTVLFFDLLEFEIRDIITIVENVRYHNEDPDQIKRCLIREL